MIASLIFGFIIATIYLILKRRQILKNRDVPKSTRNLSNNPDIIPDNSFSHFEAAVKSPSLAKDVSNIIGKRIRKNSSKQTIDEIINQVEMNPAKTVFKSKDTSVKTNQLFEISSSLNYHDHTIEDMSPNQSLPRSINHHHHQQIFDSSESPKQSHIDHDPYIVSTDSLSRKNKNNNNSLGRRHQPRRNSIKKSSQTETNQQDELDDIPYSSVVKIEEEPLYYSLDRLSRKSPTAAIHSPELSTSPPASKEYTPQMEYDVRPSTLERKKRRQHNDLAPSHPQWASPGSLHPPGTISASPTTPHTLHQDALHSKPMHSTDLHTKGPLLSFDKIPISASSILDACRSQEVDNSKSKNYNSLSRTRNAVPFSSQDESNHHNTTLTLTLLAFPERNYIRLGLIYRN